MQDTLNQSDTDWLTLIDFESEAACEAGLGGTVEDCDKPAEWKITTSCCGKSLLLCDPHNQQNNEFYNGNPTISFVTCTLCKSSVAKDDHIASVVKI